METVTLQHLSIGYQLKGTTKVVASEVNAVLNCGELTCLLGPNGIGKSTLLRTLAAFQPPLSGDILMCSNTHHLMPEYKLPATNGRLSLSSLSDKELSKLIGIVLTEKPDVKAMTVEELVAMGRSPYTGFWGTLDDSDRDIVREAMQLVGVDALAGRQLSTLSDGERQKVMIAKALAQQTPVIYLDEPTAFLDYPSKVETMLLLRRLAAEQQKTLLLSTHDVELALQLADCLWLMEPGQLSVGTPRQLADLGVLSRFIDRKGIRLDRNTLRISVSKD